MLALFGPLWSPATALATRDSRSFTCRCAPTSPAWRRPGRRCWNPWINGGQPLLSNPSYGAFYPPSWLVLAVTPAYAINLLVLLHAALAFAGAWVLARRLGGGRGAAAMAAVGYVAAGAFVSLLHAFNLFLGMAWFPWVVAAGEAVLHHPATAGRGWWRPAAGGAAAFALQMLNGEPVTVLVSRPRPGRPRRPARPRRPERRLRLIAPVAPRRAPRRGPDPAHRRGASRDSPRADALDVAGATAWSAPPARLAELVLPRLFGDPARVERGRPLLRLGASRPALPLRRVDLSGAARRRARRWRRWPRWRVRGAAAWLARRRRRRLPRRRPPQPALRWLQQPPAAARHACATRRSSCSWPWPCSPSPPPSAGSG